MSSVSPRHTIEARLKSPNKTHEPRAEATEIPEICGFRDGTTITKCASGFTCKFNTDLYAVGCCSDDACDWQTSCCDYNPSPPTVTWGIFTSQCGGPTASLVGSCVDPEVPFCITIRYENGFTQFYCTSASDSLTRSAYFTSAGETTAWPGLPRLTGRNGPASVLPQGVTTVTVKVTETTAVTPEPGLIAGSVVGGTAFGVMVALLAVLLVWFVKKRRANSAAGAQQLEPNWEMPERNSSCWDAYGRHELPTGLEGQRGQLPT